jgi:hypothetical protein
VKRSLEPTDLKLAGKAAQITGIHPFDKELGPDLKRAPAIVQGRPREAARMSVIGMIAFSTSYNRRYSFSAIYANVEFLGRHDTCVPALCTRQAKR